MSVTAVTVRRESEVSWEQAVKDALQSEEMLELEREIIARSGTGRHKFKVAFDVVAEAHSTPWHIPMFRVDVTHVGPDQG